MKKKCASVLFVLCFALLSLTQSAGAGTVAASIKPQVLQASLKSAGIESEMILSAAEGDFSRSLYIPYLGGSAVTISFPAAGLQTGRSFFLQIDDMSAIVKFTREKKLEVVAGDSRIESVIAFDIVSCIISSVSDMITAILKNVATLNIVGIVTSVLTGVINIIACI